MFFTNKEYVSPKNIILEAIFHKVPFEVFHKVYTSRNIESLEDLKDILDKSSYKKVCKCVQETFFSQTIWYLAVYKAIVTNDDTEFDISDINIEL